MNTYTLSVLVYNHPGVLARIAGLFSRRGFNIESLTVGTTEDPEVSRMTVVAGVEDKAVLEQIVKQLHKLIEVLKVLELDTSAVQRQLMLVKVRSDVENRSKVIDTVNLFRGKAVDVSQTSITLEVTGSKEKLDAMLEMLEPFGILEMVRSGHVALGRGGRAITDKTRSDRQRELRD